MLAASLLCASATAAGTIENCSLAENKQHSSFQSRLDKRTGVIHLALSLRWFSQIF